jgi:opacity protein-like surface antigen
VTRSFKSLKVFGFATAFTLAFTTAAQAQNGSGVVLQGIGGVTKAAETKPFAGASIGGKVGVLELDAEAGKLFDILPKGVLDRANQLSPNIKAELPAWYGLGQLRFIAKNGGVKPFVNVGAGAARLKPQLDATSGSNTVTTVFGSGNDTERTRFLVAAGGGLRFDSGRAVLDGGYRFMRIFQNYESDTNFDNDDILVSFHTFYVALGIRF